MDSYLPECTGRFSEQEFFFVTQCYQSLKLSSAITYEAIALQVIFNPFNKAKIQKFHEEAILSKGESPPPPWLRLFHML